MKSEFNVSAVYPVTNWGGYEIEISKNCESARVRDCFGGEPYKNGRWQEIKFDCKGDSFVNHHGKRLYLFDFMIV